MEFFICNIEESDRKWKGGLMKTKLYRKFLKQFIPYVIGTHIRDEKLCTLAHFWRYYAKDGFRSKESEAVSSKSNFINSLHAFYCKYEKFSRKYWMSSSRLKRTIFSGSDV